MKLPRATDFHATELKLAVERQHGGTATFVKSVSVHESLYGKTVWNGAVQVFDLADSPSGASRAYAWSHGVEDGRRWSVTVLHLPPVSVARAAVRSIITSDGRFAGTPRPLS